MYQLLPILCTIVTDFAAVLLQKMLHSLLPKTLYYYLPITVLSYYIKAQRFFYSSGRKFILTKETLSICLKIIIKKIFAPAVFILMPTFLITSCKKKENSVCVGCNNPIAFNITDSDNKIGYLYKNNVNDNPNVPDFNFGIWFEDTDCSNCIHTFFICNEAFLNGIGGIPEYPGVMVKFSGKAMNLCKKPFHPAGYTYHHIILTKIQKQ